MKAKVGVATNYHILMEIRQVGKASDFDSDMHRFESCISCHIELDGMFEFCKLVKLIVVDLYTETI